ncbi:MAG: DedA family protein [Treponema sp.]|nr:DedA family protein [Treponema sp.]
MDGIIDFLLSYVHYWPPVALFTLILAGFNLPVSEDAIIIVSATLVHQEQADLFTTYICVYLGIFISDVISYYVGRLISKGFLSFKFLRKKLTEKNIKWVSDRLEKHGFLTFIICRFIPFGVRNMLFMGSGFVNFPITKFLLVDSIAAFISSATLFTLTYFIGEAIETNWKILGIVLFVVFAIILVVLFARHKKKKQQKKQAVAEEKENQ